MSLSQRVALGMVLALCGLPVLASQCCVVRQATVEVTAEVVASGLDRPWAMAFLPDGSVLVTERTGALRHVRDGSVSDPLRGVPRAAVVGQGGLLDIALDPDFSQTGLVFLSYAEEAGGSGDFGTAVGHGRLNLNAGRLDNFTRIFQANNKSGGGRHFGSRLRFAPDRTLFVTLGDRGTQLRAQDPFDHAGSVVRVNRDGSVPVDNPFADGRKALPEIWSIGHRNAQGAAIHPVTGKLWTLSHGAAGGDEINAPKAGLNYGWPLISYGTNYSGAPFERGTEAPGFEQPIYYWDPSIAPSGLAFYDPGNARIDGWRGSLLAGALRGQHLSRLILNGERVVAEERYFEGEFGRIRDVRTGPDGAVWMLTDSSRGRLIRVTGAR
ncbi:MAG: PQQ-dependent sugar dehydrogenase [Pseudomonadota bacterium]